MPTISSANLFALVSTVIMIGVTLGLSGYVYQSERDRTFNEHLSRMERETALLVGDVSNRISTLALATSATAQHISQAARDRPGDSPIGNMRSFLVDITRNLPTIRTIIVLDPSGVVTDDLRPGQPALGIDVHDRKYFRAHKAGTASGVTINDPVTSRLDGKWTWPVAVAARDEKGKLLAVVVSSVDVRYFGSTVDRPVSSQDLESLIIHKNGTLLQATNQEESNVAEKISDYSLINAVKKNGSVVSDSTTDPFGRPNQIATAMKVPHWPVFGVNLLKRKIIDEKLIRLQMFIIFFSGITCLMILATTYFQIRHNLHRTRTEKELRRHRDELEDTVAERTQELIVAQDELVRKESLATLGRLTATISHELRNPLGVITNSVFTLKNQLKGKTDGLTKVMDRINRNALRCSAIIEEMLEFVRIQEPSFEAIEFDRWLKEILKDYDIPPKISLKLDLLAEGAIVKLNPERFQRAMINLLENASQAMEGQEGNAGEPNILNVTTQVDSGSLIVQIEDTGPGLSKDVLDHAFEPLFSTKSYGVGLGLAIVEKILLSHHGTISLSNRENNTGTKVTLKIPCAL